MVRVLPLAFLVILASCRWFEPDRFGGERDFVVVLESSSGDSGRPDSHVLVSRLEGLGIRAEVAESGDRRMVLVLKGVKDPAEFLPLVVPRRLLSFHLVAEDRGPFDPRRADEVTPVVPTRKVPWGNGVEYVAASCEDLAPVLARAAGLDRRRGACQCETRDAGRRECVPVLLEAPPALTGLDVARARVGTDEQGMTYVQIDFTPDGALRFADLTGRSVERKLAIVIDDRIESAPIIRERITGGKARITMGSRVQAPQAAQDEARALAVALSVGEFLTGDWKVVSMTPK